MVQPTLKSKITIPFPSARLAEICYNVLRIDPEPPRSSVTKEFFLHNKVLDVHFSANEARRLRVGVTSFMENVILICETFEQFGPPDSNKYSQ